MGYRPVRRFVVTERSMTPALEPGDGLVAVRSFRLRRGTVVVFPHPDDPERWLVKRVAGLPGDDVDLGTHRRRVDPDRMIVLSDNRRATDVDSRIFGPVPIAGTYRVVLRIPSRWLGGRR